ncbi:hypothetical protein PybrP1_011481 [[Pythium] brassicae (nom. inval.)]|nr:hypothetical protein PybrP1_011481 [[Pythium] brassicae (nom. inval.)]
MRSSSSAEWVLQLLRHLYQQVTFAREQNMRASSQRYRVREKLADTLFGGVFLCEDTRHDGAFVAIKHVLLSKAKHALETLAGSIDNPWVERSTLVQLARLEPHANILRVRDEFIEDDAWHVVMDHCGGGDLLGALQRTPTHRFFSAAATDLLEALLEVNPAARCTIEDVAAHVAAAFPPIGGL